MFSLNRVKVDRFDLKDSFSLEEIERGTYKLISMEEQFKSFKKIELNKRKLELFLNGVNLSLDLEDGLYNVYSEGKYIGLGTLREKLLKRDIIDE